MTSRSSWQRPPASQLGTLGWTNGPCSQQTIRASAAVLPSAGETSNSQYGEWAYRPVTSPTTTGSRSTSGSRYPTSTSMIDASKSFDQNFGWKSIVAASNASSSSVTGNHLAYGYPAAPDASVTVSGVDDGASSARNSRRPSQQPSGTTSAGLSGAGECSPRTISIETWPGITQNDSRTSWHQKLQQQDRSATTLGLAGNGTRAVPTKETMTMNTTNHADLLRDYARYRNLQSSLTSPAPTSPVSASLAQQHQLQRSTGAGDIVITSWRGRRLLHRPTASSLQAVSSTPATIACQNGQIVMSAEQESAQSAGIDGQVDDCSTTTFTPLRPLTGADTSTAAAPSQSVTMSPLQPTQRPGPSVDHLAPARVSLNEGLPRSWPMMSRRPVTGYTSSSSSSFVGVRSWNGTQMGDAAAEHGDTATTTSDDAAVAPVARNYPLWNTRDSVTTVARDNPLSSDDRSSTTPAVGVNADSGVPRVVDDNDDNRCYNITNNNDCSTYRSVPDFNAVPKRSILKKSRSFVAVDSVADANMPTGGSAGVVPGRGRAPVADFVRSPSLPLLYRQRTFGGPMIRASTGSADESSRYGIGSAAASRPTGKRVTFSV